MRVELDTPISVNEIASVTNARYEGLQEQYINAVTTDTREAKKHDLFIALDGENKSGEGYVSEALKKECYVISTSETSGVIRVNDTRVALLQIAEYYKYKIRPKHTLAITGSVGKSTTVKFLTKILSHKFRVHAPHGNHNNDIGVPLTLLAMPSDTEVLIVELGMNHSGEISALSKCVRPDVGVITAIGSAHIGNLGSRENIAKAKLEIRDGMSGGILVVPENEPLLSDAERSIRVSRNSSLSSFSLFNASDGSFIFISTIENITDIRFFDQREHLLTDLSLAIAVAQLLGMSGKEIQNGVRAINQGDLRQRFILLNDYMIFDDSYNASLESIVADLKFISDMHRPTGAFLGDVLELGDSAKKIHERLGFEAARLNIGHLYLFGEYAPYIKSGALAGGMNENNIYVNTDVASPDISVKQISNHHSVGEIILFKASHRLRLDKIADAIKNEEGNADE